MSAGDRPRPCQRFSETTYAVPFGIYSAGEAEPPAHEVLVGREGRRAYLIDLMINSGRRGAFLVTGRRGTGKTTFVNQCLAEYEASVYKRFLNSHVGRGLLDRTGLLVLWLLILCGGILTLSELMVSFGAIADRSPDDPQGEVRSLLAWVVLGPLGLLCLYPILYARELLQSIIWDSRLRRRNQLDPPSDPGESGFMASFAIGLLAVACWYFGPFGERLLGMSRLFAVIAALYFFAQLTSYKRPPRRERVARRVRRLAAYLRDRAVRVARPSDRSLDRQSRSAVQKLFGEFLLLSSAVVWWLASRWLRLVFTFVAVPYVLYGSNLWSDYWPSDPGPVECEYWFNLVGGLWLLALGHLLRARYHNAWQSGSTQDTPGRVMKSSARWYRRTACFHFLLVAFGLFTQQEILAALDPGVLWLFGFGVAAVTLAIWFGSRPREAEDPLTTNRTFRPLPRELLGLKVLFVTAFALQLCHPMLDRIPEPWGADTTAGQNPASTAANPQQPARPGWLTSFWHDSLNQKPLAQSSVAGSSVGSGTGDSFLPSAPQSRWLLALFLTVALIYFVEYEWIVRPSTLAREDRSLHLGTPPNWMEVDTKATASGADRHRRYAALTLPWVIFKAWLPVLVIKVNLGFDGLDHRRIIQAMLAGLRDQYQRSFLAWSSGLANLGRFLTLLFVFGAAYLTAGVWFNPAQTHDLANCPDVGHEQLPPADRLICTWQADPLRTTLYFDLLPIATPTTAGSARIGGLHCRLYHVILLLIIFLISRWVFRRFPAVPYVKNIKRIDDLLESLSARTTWTSRKGLWKPALWIYGLTTDEGDVRQTQMDPVDPRAVELAFLNILEDIQVGSVQLPGAALDQLSIPVPQLTFVFDELDKLGSRAGASAATANLPDEMPNAERQRALSLRALMSDLKNIISSAPARFIFVGGRNLHDEWLADRTARQPLLTNVFNAEIYLPSLMLDHYREKLRYLDYWINQYVRGQYRRAKHLYARWARRQWRPPMSLSVRAPQHERYISAFNNQKGRLRPPDWPVWNCDGQGMMLEGEERETFLRNFIFFLTYRSKGNPKRLRDLFATFVRPVGRVIRDHRLRWQFFPCKHVLQFNDDTVFRIQLLGDLYRHVAAVFEEQLLNRDDKLAISVFHMVDFVLRFHRRAFSWRNLERADVLAHIHRAPDLRLVVEELVEHCSERFLHRVVNGMYAFRFRSDLAREVEYISRQSADEMAAFNFTLDESQSLKALYSETLKGMEEGAVVHELVAGLGELHELDQDYEIARHHYRRALRIVDNDLKSAMGNPETAGNAGFHPVLDILDQEAAGTRYARYSTTWGIVRLRLMLQVGMTFELTRDLKRALAEYASARTLATALLKHHLGLITGDSRGADDAGERDNDRLHEIKQLNIFFLPAFAEAWAFEKLPGTLDTGHALVEEELWRLRVSLPFVNDPKVTEARDPTHMQHSNFALVMSQLHARAGDLYFFKGRQAITAADIADREINLNMKHEGYLLRAHYHYAVGLHDLRNALEERQLSSATKLNIVDPEERWPTIRYGKWPDLFSRAIGNCLEGIAEATLARTSFLGLVRGGGESLRFLEGEKADPEKSQERFGELCDQWLEGHSSWTARSTFSSRLAGVMHRTRPGFHRQDLDNWFGVAIWRRKDREADRRLVRFGSAKAPNERLLMALHLSLAGARYKEMGGYPEDAAREYLHVCETVCHYLWWGRGLIAVQSWKRDAMAEILGAPPADPGKLPLEVLGKLPRTVGRYLLALASWTLDKADCLFRQSRYEDHDEELEYLVGDVIPPLALTLLCSVGLVSCGATPTTRTRLARLLRRWTGESDIPLGRPEFRHRLRQVLQRSIRRHAYPTINRLHAIKVLIDDAVLFEEELSLDQTLAWALELLELKNGFKAPFHFTPLYSGVTFAQLHLRTADEERITPETRRGLLRIHRAAQRDLKTSEEMYTMRRAFYLAVSGLYYLYDDFNDRQIHFNHAIQMAGTEWAAILNELVNRS